MSIFTGTGSSRYGGYGSICLCLSEVPHGKCVHYPLGLVYVAMLLSYIYKVRTYHDGIYTVWLIFAASWVNDTLHILQGIFGRHKMAPKLSPKNRLKAVSAVLWHRR